MSSRNGRRKTTLQRVALASCLLLVALCGLARGGYGLGPSARYAIETRGFVVVPGGEAGFPETYEALHSRQIPVYITTDAVLHASRLLLDQALAQVEEAYLADRLEQLSRELVRLSEEQYLLAADPLVRDAARRNMAFFSVGLSLLDPDYFPPEFVLGLVERELDLMEEGRSTAFSPIMGPTPLDGVLGPGEDYSHYVAEGHYAEKEEARRFHMAVTWYGRMAFALPEGRVEDYDLTRQALLIVRCLESEAGEWLELWERVHEPLSFFVSGAGDPTVADYLALADEVFGEEFDVEATAGRDSMDAFVAAVSEIAPVHFDTHELRGMRFLRRRYYPDTRFFDRLTSVDDRPLPSVLDLLALLESPSARSILEEDEDAFGHEFYRKGFSELEAEFDAMTYQDWTRDAYWSWLYALASLTGGAPEGAPAYATGDAWDHRIVSTAAGAWTEFRSAPRPLRRSSIRPGVAPSPGAAPYVEPYPVLYARLRELFDHLRDRLLDHYLLDEELEARLTGFGVLLTFLEETSLSELAGEGPSESARWLADFGPMLRSLVGPAAPGEADERVSVSSAFRSYEKNSVLQTGVGRPDVIYVEIETTGGPVTYAGAVYSFYEFTEQGVDLLTEAEWAERVDRGGVERPWWTARFIESE